MFFFSLKNSKIKLATYLKEVVIYLHLCRFHFGKHQMVYLIDSLTYTDSNSHIWCQPYLTFALLAKQMQYKNQGQEGRPLHSEDHPALVVRSFISLQGVRSGQISLIERTIACLSIEYYCRNFTQKSVQTNKLSGIQIFKIYIFKM